MRGFKRVGLVLLVVWTWSLVVFHRGVLTPPAVSPDAKGEADWIEVDGLKHLVLKGNAYMRGFEAGKKTEGLLRLQEQELTALLFQKIPEVVLKILEVPLIRYFWGIERFIDPWMLQEMYGVSQFAPHEFDRLIDGYTRQLAYHGLHEVGQMMVDQGALDFGCTVVAAPLDSGAPKGWVLGRNFDFEGGRILDREKLVKWTFPDEGYAYVSVIWAGMVGGVTAVNEKGLYLSINAAGSDERRRYGMPSTLVLVKVMKEAATAEQALTLLRQQEMFITDIFVLVDSVQGRLYRIEKSPRTTEVIELSGPSAITNHLVSEYFKSDTVNEWRQKELTTRTRAERAEFLLRNLPPFGSENEREQQVLKILRDKGERGGRVLHLGHRSAIDALIATHSVVYNSRRRVLYVSQGPAVSGAFIGFDLQASFAKKQPVVAGQLGKDPLVSAEIFDQIYLSLERASDLRKSAQRGRCDLNEDQLDEAVNVLVPHYSLWDAQGDYWARCLKNMTRARDSWQRALDQAPAYPAERRELEKKLKEAI